MSGEIGTRNHEGVIDDGWQLPLAANAARKAAREAATIAEQDALIARVRAELADATPQPGSPKWTNPIEALTAGALTGSAATVGQEFKPLTA